MGWNSSHLRRGPAVLALTLSLTSTACGGTVYRPAASAGFELDPAAEINDEDVRSAFDAKPQMGKPVRIAYYSFDPAKAEDIEAMLRGQPGVRDVYRIPPLMMTGERRYAEATYHWNEPKKPFSIKKARLLAARAHCDVLVIFDYGHKVESAANGWVATGVLLVPLLFVPFLDKDVDSYLEAYVIDTRNGYTYAHVTAEQSGEEDFLTIYSDAANDRIGDHWNGLLAATQLKLAEVLAAEWKRTAERVPPGDEVVPVEPSVRAAETEPTEPTERVEPSEPAEDPLAP